MNAKKVTNFELFFDLIFVAAIAKATHVIFHIENGVIAPEYLLKFVLIFVPIWWAWVGQSLFINRYGDDCLTQRLFLIIQMAFTILMTASLSANFDPYYIPFLIGYLCIRFFTSIQYLWVSKRESGQRQDAAVYLGYAFLIGMAISLCSIFFDNWVRYLVLYLGIIIDLIVPVFGRKYLVKVPTNTSHLLERFSLLTIILFGESIVSLISVLHPEEGDWNAIGFAVISFIIVVTIGWQYFDNVDQKIDTAINTTGQIIIYGHLFIYISLSIIASTIRLAYLYPMDYFFLLTVSFVSVFIYFLSTTLVFHKYRFVQHRLNIYHLGLFLGILVLFLLIDLIFVVPHIVIFIQIAVFFIIYTKVTT